MLGISYIFQRSVKESGALLYPRLLSGTQLPNVCQALALYIILQQMIKSALVGMLLFYVVAGNIGSNGFLPIEMEDETMVRGY